MVEGAEVMRVLGLVLLDVRLIDPQERVHEPGTSAVHMQSIWQSIHLVQCRCDVAHHRHEEQGNLEDGVLEEVEAVDYAFVPCRMRHVDEECGDP
jgi:hypothetical protein